ncbi:hypothetical protein [Pseudooceanicola marinus]|uniref:hypothetical protein n=1 Tax=Pseudooceanicola marinus TaxID=396013 RepID=UPI001CD2540C|nr:hypothetical protein [Pseudooceanicola marinus]MCA1336740.1 hypothetical protein [Pseudooceanicola marinus]
MNDPVSNVQIEDVLASIRKLVSEEVRAQTQPEEARKGPTAFGRKGEAAPEEKAPAAPEKLILAPHLRVADPEPGSAPERDAETAIGTADDDLSDSFADAGLSFAPENDPEDPLAEEIEEAPFAEVSDEAALRGFDDAPVAFDGSSWVPAYTGAQRDDDLTGNAAEDDVLGAQREDEEPEDDVLEGTEDDDDEFDFDEMLASLNADHARSTDFSDFGDGAAEALAAAAHVDAAPVEDMADDPAKDDTAEDEAAEDARFDDLDAVLSRLDFDTDPAPRHDRSGLRDDIEDAELVEGQGDNVRSFESLFRRNETVTPVAEPEPVEAEDEPATEAPEGYRFVAPDADDPTQDADFLDGNRTDPLPEADFDAMPEHDALVGGAAQSPSELADPYQDDADDGSVTVDEEALRELVSEILRQELQGALGERITRNVRKLVRREIQRALQSKDYI